MPKARKTAKRNRAGRPSRKPTSRRATRKPISELFPDLPNVTMPKNEAPKAEPTKPVTPPTDKEIRAVFADFGTPAKETIEMPEEPFGEVAPIREPVTRSANPMLTQLHLQVSRGSTWVQQRWKGVREHRAPHADNPKHHAPAKKHATKLSRNDMQKTFKRNWKMIALVVGCVLLFALALFFAFNDPEEPVVLPEMFPQNETAETAEPPLLRIEWRGVRELCTLEFTNRVLENAKTLGRKDGNTCAKLIAEGNHPRACLQIRNLNFVALQMMRYGTQQFNETCQSQESFDATVARAYFDMFERYARYPDIGYESPAAEDFLITGELPNVDIPGFQTMPCDAEWLRANRKELEHRNNVAALTGTVSDELKQLRTAVAEMTEACTRN